LEGGEDGLFKWGNEMEISWDDLLGFSKGMAKEGMLEVRIDWMKVELRGTKVLLH
jgi:hypothetical protein